MCASSAHHQHNASDSQRNQSTNGYCIDVKLPDDSITVYVRDADDDDVKLPDDSITIYAREADDDDVKPTSDASYLDGHVCLSEASNVNYTSSQTHCPCNGLYNNRCIRHTTISPCRHHSEPSPYRRNTSRSPVRQFSLPEPCRPKDGQVVTTPYLDFDALNKVKEKISCFCNLDVSGHYLDIETVLKADAIRSFVKKWVNHDIQVSIVQWEYRTEHHIDLLLVSWYHGDITNEQSQERLKFKKVGLVLCFVVILFQIKSVYLFN